MYLIFLPDYLFIYLIISRSLKTNVSDEMTTIKETMSCTTTNLKKYNSHNSGNKIILISHVDGPHSGPHSSFDVHIVTNRLPLDPPKPKLLLLLKHC